MKSTISCRGRALALALLTSLCLMPAAGHTQIPQTLSYQGSLTDAAGTPVSGTVIMTFSLYDGLAAPTPLWQETQAVPVTNGTFDVVLGASAANPLSPAYFDIPLFLGIAVAGDPEMVPRQALAAVGYSLRALMPSGAVMFFDLAACPRGWTELAAAQGRALVGVPSGGTLNGTVGRSLANLENRPHGHAVNPAPVGSSSTGSHFHSVDPPATNVTGSPAHVHSVNPPAATSSSDSHNHRWAYFDSVETWRSGNGTFMFDYAQGIGMETGSNTRYAVAISGNSTGTRSYFTSSDAHNHSTNIGTFDSGPGGGHGHLVDIRDVNSTSAGAHDHTVDVGSTGSSAAGTEDVMPYLQLRVCRKD